LDIEKSPDSLRESGDFDYQENLIPSPFLGGREQTNIPIPSKREGLGEGSFVFVKYIMLMADCLSVHVGWANCTALRCMIN
jgi:hypothetical protein